MAQQTYEEWFVRMRFPGYETAVMNEETGFPEGWERKSLGELTETMQYGYTESANTEPIGPKFLRITDIVGRNINWENVPFCPIDEKQKSTYLLKEGDIVIARTGATVGYAKRINKNCPEAVFASYLIRLKLKPEIDDVLMGVFVESNSFLQIVQNMAGGAAQPNANAPVLRKIEMVVPPKEIQDNFREIVLKFKDSQQLMLDQNQRLREARDILLPRLMMGMIEV
jgi:type I restriction enzyme S subunit